MLVKLKIVSLWLNAIPTLTLQGEKQLTVPSETPSKKTIMIVLGDRPSKK